MSEPASPRAYPAPHLEESLRRDIDRLRQKVRQMAALDERALREALGALKERSRTLAYSVVLRDQRIDELEKEIDRLCLEFIVRQQPVAGHLRFVYATIKINAELERIGDYAESIARQVLKLDGLDLQVPLERFDEIAGLSIPMLHQAVQAFLEQNAELARSTMSIEEQADAVRNAINAELNRLEHEQRIPIEALTPLLTIARRYERVADQAKNICEEVLYMCTGEYAKHKSTECYRVVFVDDHNASASQMAEAIARSLNQPRFVFHSAGLDPRPMDPGTIAFLQDKGLDVSGLTPKPLAAVPELEQHQVFIALSPQALQAAPAPPTKTVALDWSLSDPAATRGTPEEIRAAYDAAYRFLHTHLQDLTEAILGDRID